MSRICYVYPAKPTASLDSRRKLFDILKKKGAIKPDTEISIKPIDKSTLSLEPYTETLYFDLLQRQYTVEAAIQAEKEGYDAVILACYFDPGLEEAREVVKIPVVGVAEASFAFAHMLGRKRGSIAIVVIAEKGVLKTLDVIEKYGFSSQLISTRPVRQVSLEAYMKGMTTGNASDIQALKDEFAKVAMECIRDGAEVIIPGCAGLGPFLTTEGVVEIEGVPILDCVTCAIKMAENLIDLQKLGMSVSRRLMYRPPSEEDWKRERENFGFA